MDIYTYAYEGRLMYEQHSLFPEGWVFSNQYHIVSSPNVSALFYPIFGDSVKSMAFASTLNTLFVILAFVWFLSGMVSRLGLSVGVLCLIGGTIFGTDAARYISGYQVLYTMSSFYTCYLIGVLITIGCWLRMRERNKVSPIIVAIAVALNFALGMQSLREILILNIPLALLEFLLVFFEIREYKVSFWKAIRNKASFFVLLILVVEMSGYLFMKSLNVMTTPNIGELHLDLSISGLTANLWISVKNILRVSGVAIASDGIEYLPLSICAFFVALVVLWSLASILRKKDDSLLAKYILFSFISLLCVFGVGVFLMRTRDIYYFVYWLLAALSVVYLFEHLGKKTVCYAGIALAIISVINFGYNFIPDFISYNKYHNELDNYTASLLDRGVEVLYVGGCSPLFAASSKDKIVSQAFWIDINAPEGYPFTVFPSDKNIDVFDDEHYVNSVICMGDTYLDYIETVSEDYRSLLEDKLVFFDELKLGDSRYVLYTTKGRAIQPVRYPE